MRGAAVFEAGVGLFVTNVLFTSRVRSPARAFLSALGLIFHRAGFHSAKTSLSVPGLFVLAFSELLLRLFDGRPDRKAPLALLVLQLSRDLHQRRIYQPADT